VRILLHHCSSWGQTGSVHFAVPAVGESRICVQTVCVHILAGKVQACITAPCFDGINGHAWFRNVEFQGCYVGSHWQWTCVEDLKRDKEDRRSTCHLLLTLKNSDWMLHGDRYFCVFVQVHAVRKWSCSLHKGTNLADVRMASNVRLSHDVG
jgi:hypothetical protein